MTHLKDDKVAKSGILMSEYPARALKKRDCRASVYEVTTPQQ